VERALVTGGAGFLGSHVAEQLLANGVEVVALDDLSGGFRDNVVDGVEFREGSILDPALIERLFEQFRFDYVFHLAAYAAEGLSHFIRRFNYTNNVIGSINLINAAANHEVRCFVFTSSIAVYGESPPPCSEDTTPAPADPYGVAKLAVEHDLRAARKIFGLNSIIFRPHNVYGERQNLADPYRNVIGIFMNRIFEGRPCPLFGDGSQTRAFTHVDDVAPLMAQSVYRKSAYNEVFNIGSDESCSIRDLAQRVQAAMGREVGVEHLPPRRECQHAQATHEKLARVFDRNTVVGLDQGLERMAAWARGVTIPKAKPVSRLEVRRGLPPSWEALIRDDT
jgi:UDP-glucose 4-epimerase